MKKKIKQYLEQVAEIKTSPKSIALGFAFGTFIAVIPTPGFNILIGLFLIFLFPKISKLSLFGAMALWNPLVLIPVYFLSQKFGGLIFGVAPVVNYEISIPNQIFFFTKRFLLGNLIIALVLSFIGYFAARKIAKKYQSN